MRERPILFSGAMVRALLNGTKTQTRRVVKRQPADLWPEGVTCQSDARGPIRIRPADVRVHLGEDGLSYDAACEFVGPIACPYGRTGDRLWVRETFDKRAWDTSFPDYAYKATVRSPLGKFGDKWTPSIHMPRWASRIALEIVSVRVERLQAISEADAEAEGIETVRVSETDFRYVNYLRADRAQYPKEAACGRAVQCYATLWESINGPGSWDANPFVWVVEFKRAQ